MVIPKGEVILEFCYWPLLSPWWLLAGIPIKSTMDNSTTIQYAGLMHSFIMKARSTVRDIDPQNDLTFLRIRSKKNEIMVAPGKSEWGELRHQRIQQNAFLVGFAIVRCCLFCGVETEPEKWVLHAAVLYNIYSTLFQRVCLLFFSWRLLSLTLSLLFNILTWEISFHFIFITVERIK